MMKIFWEERIGNSKFFIILVCFVLGALTSCTTYTKSGFSGGFDEIRLGEDVWRVSAKGNARASKDLIANIVMMRSADLAVQNGFSHFAIVSGSRSSQTGVNHIPGTNGGTLISYSKPTEVNTVLMFRGKPKDFNGVIYEASFICRSLGEKLKSECGKIK